MTAEQLNSALLQYVCYIPETGKLEVQFRFTDVKYVYSGISQFEFEQLRDAGSKGTYFNENIRDTYPFIKVDL